MLLINNLANGGAQRVVTLWAQMLADAGYEVTVLTVYPRPDEYPLDPRVTRANLVASFEEFNAYKYKNAKCRQLLGQYLTEHPQDLILPHLEFANLMTAFDHYQPHVKISTQTILNSPWDEKQGFNLALRDWAIQEQGSVILQNAEQSAYFGTKTFRHVKKYVVHNPLNPAIALIEKTHYGPIKKIVTVGRLAPQKNHALMIEAIRILRDEFHEKYCLDIYGVGILHDKLQTQIDDAKLGDQVKLCDYDHDIFRTLINYDLFLMTSHYEGTPNALLEAMGLGLPALAIQCRTGISELIDDGKNGYLLDTFDAHALANKIREINNAKTLAQIGRQARTDMTRYAPDKIQGELVTVVEDLLKNPPKKIATKIAIPPCTLRTQADYQNYFVISLDFIKMANYAIGKQIFKHAYRTLRKIDLTASNKVEELYRICLRANQFDVLYAYIQG